MHQLNVTVTTAHAWQPRRPRGSTVQSPATRPTRKATSVLRSSVGHSVTAVTSRTPPCVVCAGNSIPASLPTVFTSRLRRRSVRSRARSRTDRCRGVTERLRESSGETNHPFYPSTELSSCLSSIGGFCSFHSIKKICLNAHALDFVDGSRKNSMVPVRCSCRHLQVQVRLVPHFLSRSFCTSEPPVGHGQMVRADHHEAIDRVLRQSNTLG